MAYIDVDDVKEYLGPLETDDDALLTRLCSAAQRMVEIHTDKVFEIGSDTTRYFDPTVDVRSGILFFDEWLWSVTTLTNGDGTVLTTTDYQLVAPNKTPYYGVKLKLNSSKYWTYQTNPENAISLVGKWGFSLTPPADIVQITLRIAAWLYRQKDSQIFDQTAFTEIGAIRMKASIPHDIVQLLDPYRALSR
jgi:hypothetical protein